MDSRAAARPSRAKNTAQVDNKWQQRLRKHCPPHVQLLFSLLQAAVSSPGHCGRTRGAHTTSQVKKTRFRTGSRSLQTEVSWTRAAGHTAGVLSLYMVHLLAVVTGMFVLYLSVLG